jgi:hypothetical protein
MTSFRGNDASYQNTGLLPSASASRHRPGQEDAPQGLGDLSDEAPLAELKEYDPNVSEDLAIASASTINTSENGLA